MGNEREGGGRNGWGGVEGRSIVEGWKEDKRLW